MTTEEFLAALEKLLATPEEHETVLGVRRLFASWPEDTLPDHVVARVIELASPVKSLFTLTGVPVALDAEYVRESPADARLMARAKDAATQQLLRCSAEMDALFEERLIPRYHDRVMARYRGMEHGILGKTRVLAKVTPGQPEYEIDEVAELREGDPIELYEVEFEIEFCRLDLISPTGRRTDHEQSLVRMSIEMRPHEDEFRFTYRLPERAMKQVLEDYWERELQYYDTEVE